MEWPGITPWERVSSAPHADCSVFRILRERWANARQREAGDFYVMEVGDWAVAVALTASGGCVLVRQFRFGTGTLTWEMPAGVVDPGEDPVAAGVRELYEESGYKGARASLLATVHPNPAIQRNRCHFVLVEDARRVDGGAPERHECFEVREVPLATVFDWARDGTVTHAIVHAALFHLRDRLEQARPVSP